MVEIKLEEGSITGVLGELENILAAFENPFNEQSDVHDDIASRKKGNKIIDDNEQSDKKEKFQNFTGSGEFSCQFCEDSFSTRVSFNKHCRTNHGKSGKYSCTDCDYTSFFERTLTVHYTRNHKDFTATEKLLCTYCNYTTFSKGALLMHYRKHEELKKKGKKRI